MLLVYIYIYIITITAAAGAGRREVPAIAAVDRRGPKGRLTKGRKQRGLKHNETYRTPMFCTVPLPKVLLVPSKIAAVDQQLGCRDGYCQSCLLW